MRISDWSSDVCSSDFAVVGVEHRVLHEARGAQQGAGKGVGGAGVERVDVVDGGVEQLCQRDHVVAGGGLVQADADRSVVDAAQVDAGLRGPGVDCGRVHAGDVQRVEEITADLDARSEEHTSELQSLMRISYAVFCLKT